MIRMTRLGLFCALATMTVLVAGCGSGSGLNSVQGTVTQGGSPLEGATVEFQPTAEGGSPSSGVTDANGHYELMFTSDKAGAMVGEHTVSITGPATAQEGVDEEEEGELLAEKQATVEGGSNTIDFDL